MAIVVHPRAWLKRRRARHEADYWISHGLGFEARYRWRVAELTCDRERKSCARSVHSVVRELEGSALPGAAPLRLAALRPHTALLEALEARLLDDRPVDAAGMLAVDRLLTSPDSCLFAEVDDVAACLRDVVAKLEAR